MDRTIKPRGLFIVFYGANNLGKSRQFYLLEKVWQEMERPYTRIKYPIYDSPTGQRINSVLRPLDGQKVEMTEEYLQSIFADNRRWYEPTLYRLLSEGDVMAEDYWGTGIAWGLTRGVAREKLDEFNRDMRRPDIAILLDGERYTSGIEVKHRNEAAGQEVWETNRIIHRELAAEFGWDMVDANGTEEEVHERIRKVIWGHLGLK